MDITQVPVVDGCHAKTYSPAEEVLKQLPVSDPDPLVFLPHVPASEITAGEAHVPVPLGDVVEVVDEVVDVVVDVVPGH